MIIIFILFLNNQSDQILLGYVNNFETNIKNKAKFSMLVLKINILKLKMQASANQVTIVYISCIQHHECRIQN